VLVAMEPFGEGVDAEHTGRAIGRGLQAANQALGVNVCPIEPRASDVRKLLEALDFDARMRASKAVVVGASRLDEATLLGSAVFEIATRARQAGVPAYAVTGENRLSPFDARILDLQVIVEARGTRALRRAGERLAGVV
jgi:glycerate kinase